MLGGTSTYVRGNIRTCLGNIRILCGADLHGDVAFFGADTLHNDLLNQTKLDLAVFITKSILQVVADELAKFLRCCTELLLGVLDVGKAWKNSHIFGTFLSFGVLS